MDQVNEKATFRDDDNFGRKEYAQMAMKLISQHPSERGACSIAVDAPWGMGKSTFLHMWINELDLGNPNFTAAQEMDPPYESMFAGKCVLPVYYNAWENDYCDKALIPLLFTLCAQMEKKQQEGQFLADQGEKIVDFISTCARLLTSLTISLSTENPVIAEAGGAAAGFFTKGILHNLTRYLDKKSKIDPEETISAEYDKQLRIRQDFHNALEELATISDGVYIFIDELDRCKPSFAVETLEVIKHFFNIPNVVFVFAVDQSQLCHAISGLYGSNMDAGGYLTKFFDYQIRLLPPTSVQLVQNYRHEIPGFNEDFYPVLEDAFRACNLTPREIPWIIRQANAIFRIWFSECSFSTSSAPYTLIVTLLGMKLRNPQMYNAFMAVRNDWDFANWKDNHPMIHRIINSVSAYMNRPNGQVRVQLMQRLNHIDPNALVDDDILIMRMCYAIATSFQYAALFKDSLHTIIELSTPN